MPPRAAPLLVAFLAAPAAAQTTLYAVRASGDLLRLDPATGAATPIASCGFPVRSAAVDNTCPFGPGTLCRESILAVGAEPPQSGHLLGLNRWTGSTTSTLVISSLPAGYHVHSVTPSQESISYALLNPDQPPATSLLARLSPTGACTVIGPTGRSDIEAVAGPGPLYALGTGGGGTLCTLDPATGAATAIGGGTFDGDTTALGYGPGGVLLAAGANLRRVDPASGATTLIGPTGFTDLRGVGVITRSGCYATCEPMPNGMPAPFTCFLLRFASGDPWANCDESTTPPVLNVADFTCFLQKFAAGCSSP